MYLTAILLIHHTCKNDPGPAKKGTLYNWQCLSVNLISFIIQQKLKNMYGIHFLFLLNSN